MYTGEEEELIKSMYTDEQLKEVSASLSAAVAPLLELMSQQQVKTATLLKPIIDVIGENQRQLSDSMMSLLEPLNNYFKETSKLLEPIYKSLPNLVESISRLDEVKLFNSVLTKHYWPMHFYKELEFIELVLSGNDNLDEAIIDYFTIDRLEEIKKYLINYDPSREQIFNEVFDNYYNERYYSCVSLLMCQVDDLTVSKETKSKFKEQLEKSDKDIKEMLEDINEEYNVKFDSEKPLHNRIKLLISTYEDDFLPRIDFMQVVIEAFRSVEGKRRWERFPYRNKICHGKQTNFGTKNHALKTMFLTYGLCKMNDMF